MALRQKNKEKTKVKSRALVLRDRPDESSTWSFTQSGVKRPVNWQCTPSRDDYIEMVIGSCRVRAVLDLEEKG
jgi:hypothetical protein